MFEGGRESVDFVMKLGWRLEKWSWLFKMV
jgi:hypothetical protein